MSSLRSRSRDRVARWRRTRPIRTTRPRGTRTSRPSSGRPPGRRFQWVRGSRLRPRSWAGGSPTSTRSPTSFLRHAGRGASPRYMSQRRSAAGGQRRRSSAAGPRRAEAARASRRDQHPTQDARSRDDAATRARTAGDRLLLRLPMRHEPTSRVAARQRVASTSPLPRWPAGSPQGGTFASLPTNTRSSSACSGGAPCGARPTRPSRAR